MNRPPSTYQILITGTGGGGSSDPTNFTLGASGDTSVPLSLPIAGGTLHLHSVDILAAGNFVYQPSAPPVNWTPADITVVVPAPWAWNIVPAKINGSTNCFPFVLCYGPLGAEGR